MTPPVPQGDHGARDYDLPDAALLAPEGPAFERLAWRPQRLCVVIGRGNDPRLAVAAEAVALRGIPVYRRPSGGEAVVLSPATAVLSLVFRPDLRRPSREYFNRLNEAVRRALEELGAGGVGPAGISDLEIGGRKISGSAIYRNRHLVFCHAVLNVAESPLTLEELLPMPGRMPEYRRGRPHRDFVTSLHEAGFPLPVETVVDALVRAVDKPVSEGPSPAGPPPPG
jgi:lipoate-protein ligase A